ncbi:MAG TPA: hypothetical protein PKK26_11125 [Candidatus Wallbacteria bacterium]|nr:hypothetical protein [Candidatus Wallbacteria bacterium]
MMKLRMNKAFTIVEVLVVLVLTVGVMSVGYNMFTNSYFFVRTSGEKLQNIHAVSILMEGLRYELSSLPTLDSDNTDIITQTKDTWIKSFFYNKTLWTDSGKSNKPSVIRYEFDEKAREIVKTVDGNSQRFGRGRIKDFGIKHNYDPAVQNNPDKFKPVYFTVKISALADENVSRAHEEVKVQYTIYPRLLNKNFQLNNEIKD